MRLADDTLRPIGAHITRGPSGTTLHDGPSEAQQLVLLDRPSLAGRDVVLTVSLEPLGVEGTRFVLHNPGERDLFCLTRSGEIAFADQAFVTGTAIQSLPDGSLDATIHMRCPPRGLAFGLARPASLYAGSGRPQFRIRQLSVDPIPTAPERYSLYEPKNVRVVPDALRLLRIVIPVHPPKIEWLRGFLRSLDERAHEAECAACAVVLLLTSAADDAVFRSLCNELELGFPVEALDLDRAMRTSLGFVAAAQHASTGARNAMAVFKKLVGLWALSLGDPDEMLNLCLDADTICARWDVKIAQAARHNYQDARYFGARVPLDSIFYNINQTASSHISSENVKIFQSDLDIYTWFFDAPTYRSGDFLSVMRQLGSVHGGIEEFFRSLDWGSFEHTIFQYARRLADATLVDYGAPPSSLPAAIPEHLGLESLIRIALAHNYVPLWTSRGAYNAAGPALRRLVNPYFLYHADRV